MKKILVITGPSGVGKTTLCSELIRLRPTMYGALISHTTRSKRPGEVDGRDYHFVSEEEFQTLLSLNEFLEYVQSPTGYYGLSRSEVDRVWEEYPFAILVADVKGALEIQRLYPIETALVFIIPPSWDEITQRLEERGTETPQTFKKRLLESREYVKSIPHYDHVVVNEVLMETVLHVHNIMQTYKFLRSTHPENVDWKHLLGD